MKMKRSISDIYVGWIYFFIHFSVELACFYFLFSRLSTSPLWWGLAMIFDTLAFLPQSTLGIILDKYKNPYFGVGGCILILFALVCKIDLISLVFIGIGNSLVHIDGAQKTLTEVENKIMPCSIFVGGGSFGLVAGQLLGDLRNEKYIIIPLVFMIISFILSVVVSILKKEYTDVYSLDIAAEKSTKVIVLLIFFAVAVRAYIAYAIPTEWNKTNIQMILLFVFMGIGKILGGVLSDSIGYRKTTFISLLVGMPFLMFGNSVMIISLIGVGLFSMTMPVTIAILNSKLVDSPCFAFGITTAALFVGTLPAFFIRPEGLLLHQILILVLSVMTLCSILICLKKGC